MLVYLAGPLFSEAERSFNETLAGKLETLGISVFLPQRDGVERDRAPYAAMPPEERRRDMFELDEARIIESDVFLIVLDGRVPDEGACVEPGIAHTGTRAAFLGSKLNPMVRVPLDHIAEDEGALMEVLDGCVAGRRLQS